MIARKSVLVFTLVFALLVGGVLTEAAAYNFGFSSFDTNASGGSGSSWSVNWGWYRPFPEPKPEPKPTPSNPTLPDDGAVVQPPTEKGLTSDESLAIAKVNAERVAMGLPALKVNMELVRLARLKSKDMADNSYFDHISPTYGSPFEMIEAAGIRYKWAGENIARASSVTIAHDAFMKSPGHRDNIVSAGYTEIGVGVHKVGRRVYETQLFIKPR